MQYPRSEWLPLLTLPWSLDIPCWILDIDFCCCRRVPLLACPAVLSGGRIARLAAPTGRYIPARGNAPGTAGAIRRVPVGAITRAGRAAICRRAGTASPETSVQRTVQGVSGQVQSGVRAKVCVGLNPQALSRPIRACCVRVPKPGALPRAGMCRPVRADISRCHGHACVAMHEGGSPEHAHASVGMPPARNQRNQRSGNRCVSPELVVRRGLCEAVGS